MVGFSQKAKIIHTTKGQKKKEIIFFYGKTTTLSWVLDQWRWVEGYHFLNYTTKFGTNFIINMTA
jgi:hypothetical protein